MEPSSTTSLLPRDPAQRRRLFLLAFVNLLSGLYVGYSIGFPAVYMTYNQLSTDCEKFLVPEACAGDCVWSTAAGGECQFSDLVNCSALMSESECSAMSASCSWSNKKCQHLHGWTAAQQGVFAASMIIGGTFGAFPIGRIMDRIGRRRSFVLLGVTSIASCGLVHVACAVKNFAFLVLSNILVGFPVGAIQVLAPMYVGEMAPAAWSLQVGILIQVGITFGIFVMGVYGFAVQPADAAMADGSANYQTYFQATIAGLTALSGCISFLGLVPESTHYEQLRQQKMLAVGILSDEEGGGNPTSSVPLGDDRRSVSVEPTTDASSLLPTTPQPHSTSNPTAAAAESPFAKYSNLPFDIHETTCFGWRKTHVLCFGVSTALSACLALTGINSFIVYAPVIMQSAGLSSLVGNLLVDGWNFITTLASLPLAFRCNTTQMFNAGAVLVTLTCLLSGALVFPGVIEDDTVRNWILGIAVMAFIAAFEIGMATGYYVIAQAAFPSDARSIGAGYTIAIQYLFNVFINFMYPVGLEAFSPPGGSNQQGMAVWLLIYGTIGVGTTAFLLRFLGTAQYIASTM